MARTKIPEGKEALNIEVWSGSAKGSAKRDYAGQVTVYVDEGVGMEGFINLLESKFPSPQTMLKIKSRKSSEKTKTITLHYAAAMIKKELENL